MSGHLYGIEDIPGCESPNVILISQSIDSMLIVCWDTLNNSSQDYEILYGKEMESESEWEHIIGNTTELEFDLVAPPSEAKYVFKIRRVCIGQDTLQSPWIKTTYDFRLNREKKKFTKNLDCECGFELIDSICTPTSTALEECLAVGLIQYVRNTLDWKWNGNYIESFYSDTLVEDAKRIMTIYDEFYFDAHISKRCPVYAYPHGTLYTWDVDTGYIQRGETYGDSIWQVISSSCEFYNPDRLSLQGEYQYSHEVNETYTFIYNVFFGSSFKTGRDNLGNQCTNGRDDDNNELTDQMDASCTGPDYLNNIRATGSCENRDAKLRFSSYERSGGACTTCEFSYDGGENFNVAWPHNPVPISDPTRTYHIIMRDVPKNITLDLGIYGWDNCGEDCINGIDDDGDGLIDCADSDCPSTYCFEICDNGIDDDGDGLIDCMDADCATELGCIICDCGFEKVQSQCIASQMAYDSCIMPQLIEIANLFDIERITGGISVCANSGLTPNQIDLLRTYWAQDFSIAYNIPVINQSGQEYVSRVTSAIGLDITMDSLCFLIPIVREAYPEASGEFAFIYNGTHRNGDNEIEMVITSDTIRLFSLTLNSGCNNNIDDDEDGLLDCEDGDCNDSSNIQIEMDFATCPDEGDGTITILNPNDTNVIIRYSLDGVLQDSGILEIVGLSAGIHELSYVNLSGCFKRIEFKVLTDPWGSGTEELMHVVENASCQNGFLGSISVYQSDASLGPYNYSIDGGATFSTSLKVFSDLEPGTFDVIVRNRDGCIDRDRVTIEVDSTGYIEIDSVIVSSLDCDDKVAPQLEIHTSGDTTGYEFSIDEGKSFQSSPLFSNVPIGAHSVIVKNDYGSKVSKDFLIYGSKVALVDIEHNNEECTREIAIYYELIDSINEVAIFVNDEGPYLFEELEDNFVEYLIEVELPGTYEIRLEGTDGCIRIDSLEIIFMSPYDEPLVTSSCSTINNGTISVFYDLPNSNPEDYRYILELLENNANIKEGTTTSKSESFVADQSSPYFDNLAPGAYSLQALYLPFKGCTDEEKIAIIVPERLCHEICNNNTDDDGDGLVDCEDGDCLPTYSFDIIEPTCPSQNDGRIEFYVSSRDENNSICIDTISIDSLQAGTYQYELETIFGCEILTDSIVVNATDCIEICDNKIDDDGDGLVDCEDVDCIASPVVLGLTDAACPDYTNGTIQVTLPRLGVHDISQFEVDCEMIEVSILQFDDESEEYITFTSGRFTVVDSITTYVILTEDDDNGDVPLELVPGEYALKFGGCDGFLTVMSCVNFKMMEFEIGFYCDYEICNNNIDDDGDGLVDCEDGDCGISTLIVQEVFKLDSISGTDAFIMSTAGKRDLNFGEEKDIIINGWSNNSGGNPEQNVRSFVNFPISHLLQEGVEVEEATLTLFGIENYTRSNGGQFGQNDVKIFLASAPWEETSLTWNNQPAYIDSLYALIPQNNDYDSIEVNVMPLMNFIIDNDLEFYGFVLRQSVESPHRSMVFHSSESGDQSLTPELNIIYSSVLELEQPTCPNQLGAIDIQLEDSTLTYSLDGVDFEAVGRFDSLSAGDYNLYINSIHGCLDTVLFSIDTISCIEICDNNIDDDGDGLVDCEDGDCAVLEQPVVTVKHPDCPMKENGAIHLERRIPVLKMTFNHGNATDEAGDNHGTVDGATLTEDRYGNLNQAYYFDGIDDFIEVEDDETLDFDSTFSIALWFNQESARVGGHRLIDKTTAGEQDGYLFDIFSGNNEIAKSLRHCSIGCAYQSTHHEFQFWNHGAMVFENGMVSIYLNGVKIHTETFSGSTINKNDLPLFIGKAQGAIATDEFFHGSLDDIFVYDDALSQEDIDWLYGGAVESSLSYSLNGGPYQESGLFDSLTSGQYSIDIANSNECSRTILVDLEDRDCIEICDNNIDDDGDGLVDCEDGDCNYTIKGVSKTIIISPDSLTGKDANVQKLVGTDRENTNFPDPEYWAIQVWTAGGALRTTRALTNFEELSELGNEEIESAMLTLHGDLSIGTGTLVPSGDNEVTIHLITEPWDEYSVTYNNQPEYSLEHVKVIPTMVGYSEVQLDVTNLIKEYVTGGYYGFLFKNTNEVIFKSMTFHSSNADSAHVRPSLAITTNGDIHISQPSCPDNNNGSIGFSTQDSTHTYSVDGISYSNTPLFENLVAGVYSVYVMTESGCINTIEVELEEEACIEICDNNIDDDGDGLVDCEDGDCGVLELTPVSISNTTCLESHDGSVTLNYTSADSLSLPIEYSIDGGDNYQLSGTFDSLARGSYYSIVRNTSGCLSSTSFTIGSQSALSIQSIDIVPVSCPSNSEGVISINASGDTSNYQYSIDGGVQFYNTSEFSFLDSGVYEIVIQDSYGCIATETVHLIGRPCIEICDNGIDDDGDSLIDCEDDDCVPMYTYELIWPTCPANNDGSIIIFTDISEGSLNSDGFQDTVIYANLESGEYQYNIENSNGCLIATEIINLAIDSTFVGASCDDGEACTVHDVYDSDCNCAGTYADSDNDNVCDAEDQCPGQDDNIDTDDDNIPDGCDSDCTIPITAESFNNTRGDFIYISGLFGTSNPTYEDENILANTIQIEVGGVNNSNQLNLSGGWQSNLEVLYESQVIVTMTYEMLFPGVFEEDEYSEVQVSIDGSIVNYNGNPYIDRLEGVVGGNGPDQSSGNQEVSISLGVLTAGSHQLAIGVFNNKKTWNNEITTLILDEVVIELSCPTNPVDTDGDGVFDEIDQCPGSDDNIDIDIDGIPDGCDPCIGIPDIDDDGICDDVDLCIGGVVLSQDDFTADNGGFVYSGDIVEGGVGLNQSVDLIGGLRIVLGGDTGPGATSNISGGFTKTINVPYQSELKMSLDYIISMAGFYEPHENSEIRLYINGVEQVRGIGFITGSSGNTDPIVASGIDEEYSLGLVSTGSHDITIVAYNSESSFDNEITTFDFNNIAITLSCPAEEKDSDGDGVIDELDICEGGDDNIDTDNDGTPDFCDPCPLSIDSDDDGICDDQDLCIGNYPLLENSFNSVDDSTFIEEAFDSTDPQLIQFQNVNRGKEIIVGGFSNDLVFDIYGGVTTLLDVPYEAEVQLKFTYEMVASVRNDNNEDSELRIRVNSSDILVGGVGYISRLEGIRGGNGSDPSTDLQDVMINLGTLTQGTHSISIGVYQRKMNHVSETTTLYLEQVELLLACPSEQLDSDGDGVFDEVDICEGGDDNIDTDNDGTPDFCDPCPLSIDSDDDGICDDQDLCIGNYPLLENSFNSVDDTTFTEEAFDNTDPQLIQFQNVNRGKEIIVGGFSNDLVFDIYGGVTSIIKVPYTGEVQLKLTYEMIASFRNDNNEDSELRIRVDSNDILVDGEGYVSRLEGVRGNGADLSTGLEDIEIQLGTLTQGTHSISIGVYQSKMNHVSETTTLYLDQVELLLACPSEQLDSDGDGVFDEVDICEGGDDNIDFDKDGTPDFCDPCPATYDLDGDGICDEDDLCVNSYGLLVTSFSPEEVDPFDVVYLNNTSEENTTIKNVARGKMVTIDSIPDRIRVDDLYVGIASTVDIPYASATELKIRYELISSRFNGTRENCEVRILMDGQELIYNGNTYIDRIEGVPGNNTPNDSTGVVTIPIPLGEMSPGPHEIIVGVYQSKMNRTREFATLILEEVSLSIACSANSQIDTDGDGVYDDVDVCPEGDDKIDFDLDGIPDFCDPCPYQKEALEETAVSINSIVPATCPLNNNGSVIVDVDFIGSELSIDGGENYQSSKVFTNLTPGAYIVRVKHVMDQCFGGASLVVVIPGEACDEICDNGIDDDGDGNIDCADEQCFVPSITDITGTDESCPGAADATISISGLGSGLEYSIDGGGNYSDEAQFYNLAAGIYEVIVRSNLYYCESSVESIEIYSTLCDEVCDNGIDDDGDGDIDGADSDCEQISYLGTTTVQPTLGNCPNPNDGAIVIDTDSEHLLFSIDNGASFHETNEFRGLLPGTYQLIIKHKSNNTTLPLQDVILVDPVCIEICDNDIDDDGDGDTDCEDEDCSLQNQSFSFCTVYDHINGLSQSNNQGLIFFDEAAIPIFDLLVSEGVYEFVDVKVLYTSNSTGENVTVSRSIVLDETIDLTTWALPLSEITYDTDIVIRVGVDNTLGCNQYCSDIKVVTLELVEDIVEVIEDESNYAQFKNYECGEEINHDDLVADVLSDVFSGVVQSGEILNIYGFPLIVEQLSDSVVGSDGIAGSGIVVLPFNNKSVKVSFTGLQINVNKEVKVGSVSGTARDNFDITEIIGPGSPVIEICVEKECDVDGYGFDCDGKHTVTGTLEDERGFRKDGNYKDTGQPYNEKGCNRDNRDENNNICYAGEASSQIVQDYIDDNEDLVFSTIGTQLQTISTEQEAAVQSANAACGLIRDQMNPIVTGLTSTLSLSREFVFGPGESGAEKYFGSGMSTNFTAPPKILNDGTTRDAQVKQLEALHVDLYYCDTLYVTELDLKDKVDLLLSQSQDELKLEIIALLSQVSDDQIATFKADPKTLEVWIKKEITKFLSNASDQTTGYVEPTIRLLDVERSSIDDLGISPSMVSIDDMFPGSSIEEIQDEILFQLQQGRKKINNIHSAFFLEQMAIVNEEDGNELLPLKLLNVNLGVTTTVYLSGVTISENGATLDAFVILEDPFNNTRRMVFEAMGVPFTPGGFDGGKTSLSLAEDFQIKVSNKVKLILNKGATQAMWDCQGFAGLSIDGNVELCRDVVIPLEADRETVIPDPARFQGYFNVMADSWKDVIIKMDAQPFAIAASPEFKFELDSLIVDISGVRTPSSIVPPQGYESPHLVDKKFGPTWEGVFLKKLSGSLPLVKKRDGKSIDLSVEQFLADGYGLSGTVSAIKPLSFEDGQLEGWGISVDTLSVGILQNRLAKARMHGDIQVPVLSDRLAYGASWIQNGGFSLSLGIAEDQEVPFFLGNVTLLRGSGGELTLIDGNPRLSATLHGNVNFDNLDLGVSDVKLPTFTFHDLGVFSDPSVSLGTWKLSGGEGKFDLFNMLPDQLKIYKPAEDEVGILFPLNLSFVEKIGLTAKGEVGLVAGYESDGDIQKWEYKRLDPRRFYIKQSIKERIDIEGELTFFNPGDFEEGEINYGKGFRGSLCTNFKDFNLEVGALAQFGKVDDGQESPIDYFLIDALADLPIDITLGPISIHGFGGGVSYNMVNSMEATAINFDGAGDGICGSLYDLPLGSTLSKIVYEPSREVGLGIRATTLLYAGNERVFNGSATLQLLFNSDEYGGGIRDVSLLGNGQFLADIDLDRVPKFELVDAKAIGDKETDVPPPPAGVISAFINLKYSPGIKTFTGELATYMNAGPIKGINKNGLACFADVYYSPQDWHIFVGTPQERCGLLFDLGFLKADFGSYMDIGTDLPRPAGLPQELNKLFNRNKPQESLRNSGAGFMLGTNMNFESQMDFKVAAAAIKIILGFDIMVRDFEDATCDGEPVGIGGWMASGQIYGYLHGAIEILKVKVLSAGVAALLQARLPNPTSIRAALAVTAKVLVFEKTIDFDVNIGDDCQIQANDPNDPLGLNIISHAIPDGGAHRLGTDVEPIVYFSLPIGRNYKLADDTYRATIHSITMSSSIGPIDLSYKINEGSYSINILPYNFLPASEVIIYEVKLEIFKNNISQGYESQIFEFNTAEEIAVIPVSNIEYTYPSDGMFDFFALQDQNQKGVIQLKKGQPTLFTDSEVEYFVRLERNGYESVDLPVTYGLFNRRLEYQLPELEKEGIYRASLIRRDEPKALVEEPLLDPIYFRVSRYDRFGSKIDDINSIVSSTVGNQNDCTGNDLSFRLKDIEPFGIGYNDNEAGQQFGSFRQPNRDLNSWFSNETLQLMRLEFSESIKLPDDTFLDPIIDINGSNDLTIGGTHPVVTEQIWIAGEYAETLQQTMIYDVACKLYDQFDFYQMAIMSVLPEVEIDCINGYTSILYLADGSRNPALGELSDAAVEFMCIPWVTPDAYLNEGFRVQATYDIPHLFKRTHYIIIDDSKIKN